MWDVLQFLLLRGLRDGSLVGAKPHPHLHPQIFVLSKTCAREKLAPLYLFHCWALRGIHTQHPLDEVCKEWVHEAGELGIRSRC